MHCTCEQCIVPVNHKLWYNQSSHKLRNFDKSIIISVLAMTDVGNKTSFAPQVVPLTRHVLVDRKIIHETLTAAEIGKEYGNDIHIM